MLFEHEILSNLSIQIAHKIVDYAAKKKTLQASRSWMVCYRPLVETSFVITVVATSFVVTNHMI